MNTHLQLEAAKLLKEWSIWLITIQTAILTALMAQQFIATLPTKNRWYLGLVFSFLASISCATVLVGAVPSVAQALNPPMKDAVIFCNFQVPGIYNYKQFGLIPIWVLAFFEHVFFMVGLVCQVVILISKGQVK